MEADLSSARALCEAMGGTYDEQAVRLVLAMDQLLAHLPIEQQPGQFKIILNAIEGQVEDKGLGQPLVVRHLGDALLALASIRELGTRRVKKLTMLLGQLHSHVVDVAASRPVR